MIDDLKDFTIPLKLNNMIFQCKIDGKFHNVLDKKVYAVQMVTTITIDPTTKQPGFGTSIILVCDDCYKNKQYNFKDPSPIIMPQVNDRMVKDVIAKDPTGKGGRT